MELHVPESMTLYQLCEIITNFCMLCKHSFTDDDDEDGDTKRSDWQEMINLYIKLKLNQNVIWWCELNRANLLSKKKSNIPDEINNCQLKLNENCFFCISFHHHLVIAQIGGYYNLLSLMLEWVMNLSVVAYIINENRKRWQ